MLFVYSSDRYSNARVFQVTGLENPLPIPDSIILDTINGVDATERNPMLNFSKKLRSYYIKEAGVDNVIDIPNAGLPENGAIMSNGKGDSIGINISWDEAIAPGAIWIVTLAHRFTEGINCEYYAVKMDDQKIDIGYFNWLPNSAGLDRAQLTLAFDKPDRPEIFDHEFGHKSDR